MLRKHWFGSTVLLAVVLAVGAGLASWKRSTLAAANGGDQMEIPETVTVTAAQQRNYAPSATAIGTVLALRSITLANELPGTVREVALQPGTVVEAGSVLLRLDTAVEQAELKALQAEAELARTRLQRMRKLVAKGATSMEELEQAQAQHAVMQAQLKRTTAVIERKTLRAPFRARVGISDIHPGQYLDVGTVITTLQGVDDALHIDFVVAQQVAAGLAVGDEVVVAGKAETTARVVAIDARIDPRTRNATVRARVDSDSTLTPGASVRVRVTSAPARAAVLVSSNALRRGPEGDFLFVLGEDEAGATRAFLRRVRSGAQLGDEVIIDEGLRAGERVVAAGSFKLRDQSLVALAADELASN